MNIILMGYMGSGKSTLGKMLAARKGMQFIDFDNYIEEHEQQTIPNIFAAKGEIYFRKQEANYLTQILAEETTAIISLGGGTPCYGNNLDIIKASAGMSVYVNVPVVELTRRLWTARKGRPMLNHQDTLEKLEEYVRKHLFERSFYYHQADRVIKAEAKTAEELVNELDTQLF